MLVYRRVPQFMLFIFIVVYFAGALPRGRCAAGVQAAVAPHPQVHHPPLLALQGGLGLDHPPPRHLHRHLHALLGSLSARGGNTAC